MGSFPVARPAINRPCATQLDHPPREDHGTTDERVAGLSQNHIDGAAWMQADPAGQFNAVASLGDAVHNAANLDSRPNHPSRH